MRAFEVRHFPICFLEGFENIGVCLAYTVLHWLAGAIIVRDLGVVSSLRPFSSSQQYRMTLSRGLITL